MNRFILHTALLLLPVIALLVIIEILYTNVPNEYSIKSDYLEANIDSIQAVILGPSATYRGIDPSYIKVPTYNGSVRGVDTELNKLIISGLLKRPNNLRHIILSISFNDFHFRVRDMNSFSLVYFSKYFGLPEFRSFIAQEKGAKMLSLIYQHFVKNDAPRYGIQENGFRIYKTQAKNFHLKTSRLAKSLTLRNPKYIDGNIKNIRDIIELCKKNSVTLTMIQTPLHSTMLDLLENEHKEELFHICDELSKEFDWVYHLNWMDHPDFEHSDFQDPVHLYGQGSVKLSKLINVHLNQLDSLHFSSN